MFVIILDNCVLLRDVTHLLSVIIILGRGVPIGFSGCSLLALVTLFLHPISYRSNQIKSNFIFQLIYIQTCYT